MNAIPEFRYALDPPSFEASLDSGVELIERYSPMDPSTLIAKLALLETCPHPDFFLRMQQRNLFGPWDSTFNASINSRNYPRLRKSVAWLSKLLERTALFSPGRTGLEKTARRRSSMSYLQAAEVAMSDTWKSLGWTRRVTKYIQMTLIHIWAPRTFTTCGTSNATARPREALSGGIVEPNMPIICSARRLRLWPMAYRSMYLLLPIDQVLVS